LEITPFDIPQAFQAGTYYAKTKSSGLSLGDRACLGLANSLECTAVTSDRVWAELEIKVDVALIR